MCLYVCLSLIIANVRKLIVDLEICFMLTMNKQYGNVTLGFHVKLHFDKESHFNFMIVPAGFSFHQYLTTERGYTAVTESEIPSPVGISPSSGCALACYKQICDEFIVPPSDGGTNNMCLLRFYNDTMGYTNT